HTNEGLMKHFVDFNWRAMHAQISTPSRPPTLVACVFALTSVACDGADSPAPVASPSTTSEAAKPTGGNATAPAATTTSTPDGAPADSPAPTPTGTTPPAGPSGPDDV